MFDDQDNEVDYTSNFHAKGLDADKLRVRPKKATRSNAIRRTKPAGSPGSSRLRRNKHWSW